jgi:hypothetical protein
VRGQAELSLEPPACTYDCRAGEDRLRRCLCGQVTAAIAEKLVVDAWAELLTLVTDVALVKRGVELREQWPEATMDARRDLLRELIERMPTKASARSQSAAPSPIAVPIRWRPRSRPASSR